MREVSKITKEVLEANRDKTAREIADKVGVPIGQVFNAQFKHKIKIKKQINRHLPAHIGRDSTDTFNVRIRLPGEYRTLDGAMKARDKALDILNKGAK